MAETRAKLVRSVAAPADKVFGIVAGWANLKMVMPDAVKKSSLDEAGYTRTLTLRSGEILHERLLKYDAEKRTQEYEIVDSAKNGVPFKNYRAKVRVVPETSRRCVVHWSSRFEPKRGKTPRECRDFALMIYRMGVDNTERLIKRK